MFIACPKQFPTPNNNYSQRARIFLACSAHVITCIIVDFASNPGENILILLDLYSTLDKLFCMVW